MITPYGKHYARLYAGSLYGAGAIKFAVMGYVIANQQPRDREPESAMMVELNPRMLAGILGEKEEDVVAAVRFLCEPDAQSHTKGEEGRRLVEEGQWTYRVVNGRYYRGLADEERKAERARKYTKKWRVRQMLKARQVPGAGEREYVAAFGSGAGEEELEAILAKWLPECGQMDGRGGEKDWVGAKGKT